jgi:hypothetical protein
VLRLPSRTFKGEARASRCESGGKKCQINLKRLQLTQSESIRRNWKFLTDLHNFLVPIQAFVCQLVHLLNEAPSRVIEATWYCWRKIARDLYTLAKIKASFRHIQRNNIFTRILHLTRMIFKENHKFLHTTSAISRLDTSTKNINTVVHNHIPVKYTIIALCICI